ncbi:MAG: uL15 family ribosomal protein [Promethearchaeota archaeon]
MTMKYRKKVRRYRGSRQNGWGTQGQHRKKGSRGGFGKTGLSKHKWTWTVKYAPDYFGKHGFHRPPCVVEKIKAINVKDLELSIPRLLEKGLIEKKGTFYEIDLGRLGYNKLLGAGKVTAKYNIAVKYASKKAIEKIEAAGGSVTLLSVKNEA